MNDEMQDTGDGAQALPRMACTFCRRRKLKCNRQRPMCEQCTKFGFECEYGPGILAGSSRPVGDSRSSRVRQLEDRLGRVEHLLHSKSRRDAATTPSPSTSGKDTVAEPDVGPFLDPNGIKALEERFFKFVHPVLSIIHPGRYAERTRDVNSQPPIYLRQTMWALAATVHDLYSEQSESFYQTSRKHLEEAELKNQDIEILDLAPAQTWALIAIYELNHGYFHRAWMSTSRAVRLVQMMRLHRLDGVTQVMDPTPRVLRGPNDLTDAEERRRIFWLVFSIDRSSCISMGFPSLIDERDIRTLLPVSNASFDNSTKEKSMFLSDALLARNPGDLCPTAARIVMISLCGSKLAELQRYDPAAAPIQSAESIWLRPQRLGDALMTEFVVPEHLSLPLSSLDPTTAFLNMTTFACTIAVHRAARVQLSQDAVFSEVMLSQSRKLCVEAASQIVKLMKVTSHWDICAFNPWTAYTLYLAAAAFANSWLADQDPSHEASLIFLLENLKASKKTSALATIMLSDINIEFPTLLGRLDKKIADSVSEDFLTFPESCSPTVLGATNGFTSSEYIPGADVADKTNDPLNLDKFDFSQDLPGTWDLNPSPFGRW